MSSAILLRIHDFSGGDVFSSFFVCVEVDMDALALILLLLEAGLALLLTLCLAVTFSDVGKLFGV